MNSALLSASSGSIEGKIRIAQDLFDRFGKALLEAPHIRTLLDALQTKTALSQHVTVTSGIASACRRCDEEEGGSCCGAGIENRYNPNLLLINRLMGVALPESRLSANSCYFIGPKGCLLKARHVLCVNYLCLKLQKELAQADLFKVQDAIGDELDTAFILQEAVGKFLRESNEWGPIS